MISFNRKAAQQRGAMILDTCALIDGRIVDIAKAGFATSNLVIPQFVIAELQFLADNGDSHKRERARFGLDIIRALQDLRRVDVHIAREQFPHIREVDDKLIALAKQYSGMLYTTDYNLNKVAQIEGVQVLNVNELAQALRPHHLPGEHMEIKITQAGQDKTQGVGYLDDGTMVVVERAGNKIGQRIEVAFSRILQTQAGKMMFAVLPDKQPAHPHEPQPSKQPATPQMPPTPTPPTPPKPTPPTPVQNSQPKPVPQQPKYRANAWHSPRPNRPGNNQPATTHQKQQSASPARSAPRRRSAEDSLLQAIARSQQ